jgi:D-alanyl-D-alanine carboxypeptidase/D-alanyl-D-alanine-endopeptidase (penicillin-binding protein 4)
MRNAARGPGSPREGWSVARGRRRLHVRADHDGAMRALLIAALVALTGGSAAGVVASEREEAAAETAAVASPLTPVLSARRVPAVLAAPIADRRLGVALDELLSRQPGTTCLEVTASGRSIYERLPDAPLVPASVEKLLTAVAAVEVLGLEHRFRTTVVAAAAPVDGVVAGDAWLVGGGDALLATADYAARFRHQPQVVTPLEGLADQLAQAGVVRIDGTLLGDGSRYDDDRYPDVWPERFIDQDQSGPLSALTVNDAWEAFPPNPDTAVPDEAPAADPAAHAAGVLGGLLVARGTAVAATGSGVAPPGAVEVAAIESGPLPDVLRQMLSESDNQTAELLLKELAVARGRPATTVDGAAVVLEVATELGLPLGGVVVTDGSGLSEQNLVSCRLVQSILDQGGPSGPIGAGLAVAGQTGTLTERFAGSPLAGRLVAKTGTLNQVTALAGHLATTPGASVTFAFIVNHPEGEVVTAEDLDRQAELAQVLDRYPEGPSLEELGPQPVAAAAPPADGSGGSGG